uniref:LIM zinc-binding domain-containing protein n=1 Tax=Anopheles melas TaxID=34690 RepID=A0A182U1L9_9DIPT
MPGVFVRIKDKNLHADCFKCATCGTSLKNQGYFNLNDKLYCDIHARLAALNSPPPGTNGMVPVAVTKPGHKTGVQAISAALNAHANLNGRAQSPYGSNEPGPEVPPAPQTDANAPLVFGANGLATPAATADSEQTDGTVTQNDYGFYYQTMGGRVIRSVLPPGKNSTYKVNQNNITPKPFGAPLPVSPLAQVQPPASYPPVAGSVPTPFSAALVGAPPAQPAPMAAPAPAPMAAAPAPAPAPMAAPAMAPVSVPTPQGCY